MGQFEDHPVMPQTALVDVPLRRFVDQALEGTAKAFTQAQLEACARRYQQAFDMEPPENCDPSPEQLAALWHVMALVWPRTWTLQSSTRTGPA